MKDHVREKICIVPSKEQLWFRSNMQGVLLWEVELSIQGELNTFLSELHLYETQGHYDQKNGRLYPTTDLCLPLGGCKRREATGAYYYTFQKPMLLLKQRDVHFDLRYQSENPFNAIAMMHGYPVWNH